MDNIALETDIAFRCTDGIEPCRVIFACVFEQSNVITFNERRTGGARRPGRRALASPSLCCTNCWLGRVSLICVASFTWATSQHICFHNTLPSPFYLWRIWCAAGPFDYAHFDKLSAGRAGRRNNCSPPSLKTTEGKISDCEIKNKQVCLQ